MKNKEKFIWIFLLITFKEIKQSLLENPRILFKIIRGDATSHKIEDAEEDDLENFRFKNQISQEVRSRWSDYYSCLQNLHTQGRRPEIRLLFEGQHTEFQCEICSRPFQNYDEIEWKYKPLQNNDMYDLEYLDLTHEMVLTKNKTLRIFNVVEDFAGLYVCYQKKNVISVYVLEVSKNNTVQKVFPSRTKAENFVQLNGKNFEINYQWTQWTECSSCGVGRKYQYGTCFITSKDAISNEKNNNYGINETNESQTNWNVNIFEDEEFLENSTTEDNFNQNFEIEKISKFSTGIPCASRYLPTAAFAFTQQHKPIKVSVKYCLESCDKFQIFEVLDSQGRVIEIANNSAGVFSVFQKIPELFPDIERRSVTAEFGKSIIIQCPGTLLTSIPVTWKINDKDIFPEIIAHDSKGRFIVDFVNRIQIKKLRLKDSHIYSCWQRNQLIGTVNLNVEKNFTTGFNHHLTLVAIILIIGIFLLIGNKLITRELKIRRK